jgi:hypothetical protein
MYTTSTTSTTSLASESSNQIGRPISLMRFNRRRQSSTGLVILRQGGEKQLLPSLRYALLSPTANNRITRQKRFAFLIIWFLFLFFVCFLSRRCLATRRARRQFLLFWLSFGSEKKEKTSRHFCLFIQTDVRCFCLAVAGRARQVLILSTLSPIQLMRLLVLWLLSLDSLFLPLLLERERQTLLVFTTGIWVNAETISGSVCQRSRRGHVCCYRPAVAPFLPDSDERTDWTDRLRKMGDPLLHRKMQIRSSQARHEISHIYTELMKYANSPDQTSKWN